MQRSISFIYFTLIFLLFCESRNTETNSQPLLITLFVSTVMFVLLGISSKSVRNSSFSRKHLLIVPCNRIHVAPVVTRPLALALQLNHQRWLTKKESHPIGPRVRKPEQCLLSCPGWHPPEGPRHPFIKYTSPGSSGTSAARTVLWETDTVQT